MTTDLNDFLMHNKLGHAKVLAQIDQCTKVLIGMEIFYYCKPGLDLMKLQYRPPFEQHKVKE